MSEFDETIEGIEKGDIEDQETPPDDLEKKYREQMRQIVTQKIDLPVSALPAMLDSQIKLNPEFQRRDRWDTVRQSRLIESLFMNVPIPPVFLGEDEYGHYVVLDGRQRLTAIKEFLNNTLTLQKLEVWDNLNGKIYQDLIKKGFDKHLTRRFIPAVVILKESSPAVKYDVFDRLNTGGVKANEMEIRNAVFRGDFSKLLHELSSNPKFRQMWNIPVDESQAENVEMYKQMEDLHLVLRFFALKDRKTMNMKFKDHLSDFMQKRNKEYKDEPNLKESDKKAFITAINNSWKVFGEEAFLKPANDNGKRYRSFPLSDAVMISMSDVDPSHITEGNIEAIKKSIAELFIDPIFVKSITSGTNGKGAINKRIDLMSDAIKRAL